MAEAEVIEMAIMTKVGFGMRDGGSPVLWFSVHVADGFAALQILPVEEAITLIKDAKVRDVHDLEGKPCLVSRERNMIKFVSYLKV